MSCSCVVCRRHAEVHAQVSIETLSGPASVDLEMGELMSALNARGVVTVASCIALREAVEALASHWLPELTKPSLSTIEGLNYQSVLVDRLAFVRVLAGGDSAATDSLTATARMVGGQVLVSGPILGALHIVQIAFPRQSLSRMLECLG